MSLAQCLHIALFSALVWGYEPDWPDPYFPHFHIRPEKNWINDPNGPFRRAGDPVIHVMMQYSPYSIYHMPDISWYHVVSTDYVHWARLGVGILGSTSVGIWSGSVTVVEGVPLAFYTCCNNSDWAEQQCYAVPSNISDPLLKDWELADSTTMPFIKKGPAGYDGNFRDPATMMYSEPLQQWLLPIGVGMSNYTAHVAIYGTTDFNTWTFAGYLYEQVIESGMFECPDVYQITDRHWIVKTSQGYPGDNYLFGELDPVALKFTPIQLGGDQRWDFGKTYASKSFYDPNTERRIMFTWIEEEDSWGDRTWASVMSLPRHVTWSEACMRPKTTPLEELKQLRNSTIAFQQGIHLVQMNNSTARISQTIVHANGGGVPSNLYAQQEIVAYFTSDMPYTTGLPWHSFGIGVRVGSGNHTDMYALWQPGTITGPNYLQFGTNRSESGSKGAKDELAGFLMPYPCYTPTSGKNRHTSKLTVYVDHSVIEAYLDDGISVLTARVYIPLPYEVSTGIDVFAQPSTSNQNLRVRVDNVTVYSLNQIWITEDELRSRI